MADFLYLGRTARSVELAQQAETQRFQAPWTAAAALELACAWLLAGDPAKADLAYVEADLLDPSLALVPDVWGLWPISTPPIEPDAHREAALNLAARFRRWRHPDPQVLWASVLPKLKANWQLALEHEVGDDLLILGRITASPEAPPLDPPLEPELVQLVSDAEIAAEPAASNRYWQLVASIRPRWDLALIRAADLALARGELETSGRWLNDPPPEALSNPWFHDVAARHAIQRGAVEEALDAWAEALRTASAQPDQATVIEIFEQRRREARRGPGILQVRNLAARSENERARSLLERLLAEDPQWQPFRSLKDQLLPSINASWPSVPSRDDGQGAGSGELEGFNKLLDRATTRLIQLGHPVDRASTSDSPCSSEVIHDELEAIDRRLSDYEARFALA